MAGIKFFIHHRGSLAANIHANGVRKYLSLRVGCSAEHFDKDTSRVIGGDFIEAKNALMDKIRVSFEKWYLMEKLSGETPCPTRLRNYINGECFPTKESKKKKKKAHSTLFNKTSVRNITESYLSKVLKKQGCTPELIKAFPEVLEIKKTIIQYNRFKKDKQ